MDIKSIAFLKESLRKKGNDGLLTLNSETCEEFRQLLQTLILEDLTCTKIESYRDIAELLKLIDVFEDEIKSIFNEQGKTVTTGELELVMKKTEDAVEKIIECAEEIDDLSSSIPGETGKHLKNISTRIYEASNFQDINGQRIIRVMKSFKLLEEKMIKILDKISKNISEDNKIETENKPVQTPKNKDKYERYLNGPLHPDESPSQEQIDQLLAQL